MDTFSVALKSTIWTLVFTLLVFGSCAITQQRNIEKYEGFWNEWIWKPTSERLDVDDIARCIVAANVIIWVLWKVADPQFLSTWFTLSVSSSWQIYPSMILSAFSHTSIIHLYLNMSGLLSFSSVWNQVSETEDDSTARVNSAERYLAFYLTAGIVGSLLSIIVKIVGKNPNPSLGASGAIMGVIGYSCVKLPKSIIVIPFAQRWPMTARTAKIFFIAFDLFGLLIGAVSNWRWMILDHAGHLGGMFFGMWYAIYGEKIMHNYSEFVMECVKTNSIWWWR